MALIATATTKSRRDICKILSMRNVSIVAVSPNKPNIKYTVIQKPGPLDEVFAPLVEKLKLKRTNMERTIIFCRTHDNTTGGCSEVYVCIRSRLQEEFTDPIGAPDKAKYRMVDMFTSCTHPTVKEKIIQGFCNPQSKLRIVIATVAFGVGIDCPNETGRGGRDGLPATATLYNISGVQHVEESMKSYTANKLNGGEIY